MSHTPGPWAVGDANWYTIVGPHTRWHEGKLSSVARVSLSDDENEDAANARLIAAAPELLAALERLYDAFVEDWKRSPTMPIQISCETNGVALDQARTAIAKATSQVVTGNLD